MGRFRPNCSGVRTSVSTSRAHTRLMHATAVSIARLANPSSRPGSVENRLHPPRGGQPPLTIRSRSETLVQFCVT